MNVIFLEGCQRSGNHILVQWLRGFMAKSLFIENICYSYEEQLDETIGGRPSPPFDEQMDYMREALLSNTDATDTIVSHEHPGLLADEQIDQLFGVANDFGKTSQTTLHILRDPFNWMASYAKLRAGYKKFGMSGQHKAEVGAVFENYSKYQSQYWDRWYRSYRKWKSGAQTSRVHYNKFVTNVDYRKSLASDLNLDWNLQADTNAMQREAKHGSSFNAGIDVKDIQSRFGYMIPMFLAFPIPDFIIDAAKVDFPLIYNTYLKAKAAYNAEAFN